MATLKDIVEVVCSHSTAGLNVRTYPFSNEELGVYVDIVDWPTRYRSAGVVVLARIDGDQVIIEKDTTNRPLVEALVRAGIPREQIVLNYGTIAT